MKKEEKMKSKNLEKRRMLIALIPQKEIVNNLEKIRRIANIKANERSAPHITIVDNSFEGIKKVDKKLREIAKSLKPFDSKVKGIDTFTVTKNLGIERYKQNNSLIYRIKNDSNLNNLRKEILKKLDYLKTSERLEQWIKENPKLSKRSLISIKKYGTPFGLKEWKFHTTIGLIPKEKQKEILHKIKQLDIQKKMVVDSFSLFVRKNGWKLYKRYNLGNKKRLKPSAELV